MAQSLHGAHTPGSGEVAFVVGPQRVRLTALRGLLLLSSPVFRALLSSSSEGDIELPQLDAAAFQIALSHIAGEDVSKQIEKSNMCPLFLIATTYSLQRLRAMSRKFIRKSLSRHNLLEVYRFAESKRDEPLKRMLWRWMGRRSRKCTDPLIARIFESLDADGIARLLRSEYVSVREERLFSQCLAWLKKQYQAQGKGKGSASLSASPREAMGAFVRDIRFPLMSLRFLCDEVHSAGILSDAELLGVLRAKTLRNQELCSYALRPRSRHNDADEGDLDGGLSSDDDADAHSDGDFDDVNAAHKDGDEDEEEEEKGSAHEITKRVNAIWNSGECGGYPMHNMYADGSQYWCSNSLNASAHRACWVVFDCADCLVSRLEIQFQPSYCCAAVKLYSNENRRATSVSDIERKWQKITKKENLPRGGAVHVIKIRNEEELSRFLLLRFEGWQNGYVGVQRVRFYGSDE